MTYTECANKKQYLILGEG